MNLLKRLFTRPSKEATPQLTRWQQDALSWNAQSAGAPSYALLDDMQKDAMVQNVLTLKQLAVLAAPWRIVPADASSEARARADFAVHAFRRLEGTPVGIVQRAMDAFGKGWSIQELVWRPSQGRVWLEAVRAKDPSLFGLDVNRFGKVEGVILRLPGEEPRRLPVGKFVVHVHRSGYDRPSGRSDLEAAIPHWQAKQALLSAWRLHLERFASPTVLGRFERGMAPEEQVSLLSALQNLHRNSAIVFPSEIEVSSVGGGKDSASGFLEAIDFHNREIARSVLGQTLTTDEGRRVGSMALGKVHFQVMLMQVEALRRELADGLMTEQVLRPLTELNFGPGLVPRFEFEPTQPGAFATGIMS